MKLPTVYQYMRSSRTQPLASRTFERPNELQTCKQLYLIFSHTNPRRQQHSTCQGQHVPIVPTPSGIRNEAEKTSYERSPNPSHPSPDKSSLRASTLRVST